MSAYLEECRREWKRLGVPDLLADEMAADLEADLAEAQTEGVSAEELLGESDPRRFAATWARERGLVSEPRPQRRRRIWPWVVAALAFVVLLLTWLALQTVGSSSAHSSVPVRVPRLVGLRACDAVRVGHLAGLGMLHTVYRGRCDARVVYQKPAAGTYVPLHAATTIRLSLVRIPRLVGLNGCSVKQVAGRQGLQLRKWSPNGIVDLPRSSMCKNVVLAQKPAAGQVVKRPVTLTVRMSRLRS
jgi:hypothetical protein